MTFSSAWAAPGAPEPLANLGAWVAKLQHDLHDAR